MVSVVIPTVNEEKNVEPLIRSIRDVLSDRDHEVIIVDGDSDDRTPEKVEELAEEMGDIHLLRKNREGIGSAYKHGFSHAEKEVVVQMDADFSHPPEKILHLVREVENGADLAIGSRYVEGGTRNDPLHRRINPLIGSYLYRFLVGTPVRDVTSGFKAYRYEALEQILESERSLPDGFHFQAASMVSLVESGHEPVEVPIDFMPRRAGDPKYDLRDLIDNVALLLKLGAEKRLK